MGVNLFLFVKQLTVFSVALFLLYGVSAYFLPDKYTSKAFWGFVPFFYTVALVTKALLNKLSSTKKNNLSILLVRIKVFRFILYIAVLIIYAFSFPDDAIAFVITFFVFYFIYTIFEVSSLYRDMK